MPGIFVFTAGNQAAKAHLRDSIINPVNSNIIFDSFDETYHPQLQQVLDEESGFFAWGAIPGIRNNPTWKALKINDWVFCVYGGAYHFISRVKAKFDNYNCAKNIWGLDEDGQNTWQLMYFLTKPQKPKKGFIETNNLDKYLHRSYMGFTKISDDRLKDIENEFGSVDHFVEKIVLEKEFESQEHQILKELALKSETKLKETAEFDPADIEDAREKIAASIVRRRGQPKFRKDLLDAYNNKCAISDADAVEALEAAHISPYKGEETNNVTNGILLRSDLHTLFDLGLIGIHPESKKVIVSNQLKRTTYESLNGKIITLPDEPSKSPSQKALEEHLKRWGFK